MLNLNIQNIKQVRDLAWEEVFGFWYENEAQRENWKKIALDRGFASWADWRVNAYAKPFECKNADWSLYEVDKPAETIANFYGGSFRTWVEEFYQGHDSLTFKELIKDPRLQAHAAIKSMAKDFPYDKIITCLELQDKIFIIEGMHRCCALALLNSQDKELDRSLKIAIGKSKLEKLPKVGRNTLK